MLKKEIVKSIRVIAYPKLSFPSIVSEIHPKPIINSNTSPQVKMNNASLRRIKSRNERSEIKTTIINGQSPNRNHSPMVVGKKSPNTSLVTQQEQSEMIHKKALTPPSQHNHRKEFNTPPIMEETIIPLKNTNRQVSKFIKTSSTSDFKVQCKADGSNVVFSFDKKVSVKRIRIKTPGHGLGPKYYACYVPIPTSIVGSRNNRIRVGEGELLDLEGEQYLELFVKGEGGVSCKEMHCSFVPFEGQKSFKIVDMKIDCNKTRN